MIWRAKVAVRKKRREKLEFYWEPELTMLLIKYERDEKQRFVDACSLVNEEHKKAICHEVERDLREKKSLTTCQIVAA